MTIGPAPILAFLLAVFHTALFIFLRGDSGGRRLPLLVVVTFFAAWLGDGIGARLGLDVFMLGDFHLLTASIFAWLAIVLVAIVGVLGPGGSPYARR